MLDMVLDPVRNIFILIFLLAMALVTWRRRWLRFTLLGAAVLLDSPYILVMVIMFMMSWSFEKFVIFPQMIWLYISITVLAAAIFSIIAGEKKIWRYFWLGCVIFMGLPFFLLINWFRLNETVITF